MGESGEGGAVVKRCLNSSFVQCCSGLDCVFKINLHLTMYIVKLPLLFLLLYVLLLYYYSTMSMRLFNEVRFLSVAAKEWIPRAPAVVNSSLSGMDTDKMSKVLSDSELSRLPYTTSPHLET